MCRASTEPGGPRRCSADTRAAYTRAASAVDQLERTETALDGRSAAHRRRGRPALSPSRAADYRRCPLLYRLRAIDRIPEIPPPAATRGTVVHAALEKLYTLPAADRTADTARQLIGPAWDRVLAQQPALAEHFDDEQTQALLDEARALISRYYQLEDPTAFTPESVEHRIEMQLDDGTPLRGFIDRIDVAPTGELRVVDYKTGKAPREGAAEAAALFQMKFYAVALWRARGVVPTKLRLVFLGDAQVLDYSPDEPELARFEKTLSALWQGIQEARKTGEFPPNPGRMCNFCNHQARCPAFGGNPPPYPERLPAVAS
jgi:putative RecB family exonuclease